ncbi:hypothetical protein HU200_046127 [Digitaria exilis]|uniref:Uncharacterized protein n=1 Tax=Digitaria exilis TaxID=1010633 RepID=A0A835B280_9POAL|nr:hypothetical protein HU200_046127 [Digitaria exilis]
MGLNQAVRLQTSAHWPRPRNRRRLLRLRPPPSSRGARQNQPPAGPRALDARSTAVRLAPGASVRDLKAALRSSFPPARVAPSFHLFLKVPRSSLSFPPL